MTIALPLESSASTDVDVGSISTPIVEAEGVDSATEGVGSVVTRWVLSPEREQTDAGPIEHAGTIDASYWADQTALDGMGLTVQRVKALGRELSGNVAFEPVEVVTIYGDDDDPGFDMVVLTLSFPGDEGDLEEQLFDRLPDLVSSTDLARLAVRVD